MNTKFTTYYLGTITRPAKTFENLSVDSNSILFGFFAVSITAILYTLVYIFLILGGGQPYKPWLNIPLEVYYQYNVFFCAPSMFLGWILAAAVTHTLSRLVSATGTFEQTLSLFGFGISVATWTTGIHDFIRSLLGSIHVTNQHDYEIALNTPTIWRTLLWIQMTAYLLWFVFLFSKATKSVYHLKTSSSVLLGTIGFLVYQFFFFIFNR